MRNKHLLAALSSSLILASCNAGVPQAPSADMVPLVVTPGLPVSSTPLLRPLSTGTGTVLNAQGSGSETATVSVSGCAGTTLTRMVRYTVSGSQNGTATLTFPRGYTWNGKEWVPSDVTQTQTLSFGASTSNAPRAKDASITLTVGVANTSGAAISAPVTVEATVSNSNSTGSKLSAIAPPELSTTVSNCTPVVVPPPLSPVVSNRAPELTTPGNIGPVEATGPQTPVTFTVTAQDQEEGTLTPTCTPASGSDFGLGTTTVSCTVSDTGKQLREDDTAAPDGDVRTQAGTFTVTVVDTTAPALTVPTAKLTLTASSKDGVSGLTPAGLGVSATDLVSGADKIALVCTAALPIGLNQIVSCTAKDEAGNTSEPKIFTADVTFGGGVRTLLQPVNANGSSAFKAGSTVPLKFTPPQYSGSAATDLADGLKLTVTRTGSSVGTDSEATDLSSGSTVWRYDADSGQYIFNLSTKTTYFKAGNAYAVEVSYRGVSITQGSFSLK